MQSTISFEVWVIILLFGTILVLAFYSVYSRKKVSRDEDNPYLIALKFMAEGENRLAVEKFKEAVRQNSSNIDAYIKLGTILRSEGLYKNAIRIHQDLTLRGDLEPEEVIEVKKNLILNYWYLKDYVKAELYLNQLKEDKSQIDWVTPYLVKILEKKEEWQQAIDVLNKSSLVREQKGKFKIAGLKVKQGQKHAENQEEKEARVLFKEAIKTDHECAHGYLQLGDSYLREGRTDDAISAWTDLCKKVKDKAQFAFDRLEKAWFEKGQFSKIEDLYTSMLQDNEDNLPALIALSEIYRKKGEYDESLKLLQGAQKRDLDSYLIQSQMAKVHMDKNQYKEAAILALELLSKENHSKGLEST
jgi:lipopolysaccharide biosynthesis regulator YciM